MKPRSRPGDPLSRAQAETVDYIAEHFVEHGFYPTVRDTAERLGVALHAAACRFNVIEAKGAIVRDPCKARAYRLAGGRERAALLARMDRIATEDAPA